MKASLVSLGIAAGVALTLWSGVALAATDEEKCLAGRAKAKGKYEKCIEDNLGKYYGTASPDSTKFNEKLAKCRIKYDQAWTKLQGLTGSSTCGGVPRYVDNGDGTVTDNLSGLVWEKKSDNDDIHDKDTFATWSTGSPYKGNGTAYTTFLIDGLNAGAGFAGANDWRLPTLAELGTILLPEEYPCTTFPCVAPAFNSSCEPGCAATACSCTRSGYWSASTYAPSPINAWGVYFGDGDVYNFDKTFSDYVRAVRGGS